MIEKVVSVLAISAFGTAALFILLRGIKMTTLTVYILNFFIMIIEVFRLPLTFINQGLDLFSKMLQREALILLIAQAEKEQDGQEKQD